MNEQFINEYYESKANSPWFQTTHYLRTDR